MKKRGRGRPSQGSGKKGEGKRIRDYPLLAVTIRPEVRDKLNARAAEEERPSWRIVEDAILMYLERPLSREGAVNKKDRRPRPKPGR